MRRRDAMRANAPRPLTRQSTGPVRYLFATSVPPEGGVQSTLMTETDYVLAVRGAGRRKLYHPDQAFSKQNVVLVLMSERV